jgi:biopolymer transport protein ExbD
MTDGSVELEGVRYTDPDTLKGKLVEIEARRPTPEVQIRAQNGASPQQIGPAFVLLQKAGLTKPGFLIEIPN